MLDGSTEYLARMRQGGGRGAAGDLHQPPESIFPIETERPELLDLKTSRHRRQVRRHQLCPVQLRRLCYRSLHDAPPHLHHRSQLPRASLTDTLDLPEVRGLPTRQRAY
jgi:hypothetical protein